MINIFKTVKKVFNDTASEKSEGYKKGFQECYSLFEIGFKNYTQYNMNIKLKKAEEEIEKLKIQIHIEQKTNKELYDQINGNLEEAGKSVLRKKTKKYLTDILNNDATDERKIQHLKTILRGWS